MLGRGPRLKKNYISSEINEVTSFNKIKFYSNGVNLFKDIIEDINNAESSIHIESYIFRDDVFTKDLLILLINKLKQGVKVKIVIDSNGNTSNRKDQFKEFIKAAKSRGFKIKSDLLLNFIKKMFKI